MGELSTIVSVGSCYGKYDFSTALIKRFWIGSDTQDTPGKTVVKRLPEAWTVVENFILEECPHGNQLSQTAVDLIPAFTQRGSNHGPSDRLSQLVEIKPADADTKNVAPQLFDCMVDDLKGNSLLKKFLTVIGEERSL